MKILLLMILALPAAAETPPPAAEQVIDLRDAGREEARFTRDEAGVINDNKTGLEWLEGPDVPSSWEMAQEWLSGLGSGWRTPTLAELEAIYLPDSKRKGTYGDPLCLDPAFRRDSGYSLWSVERYDGTAWMFDFSRGYAHWLDVYFPGRFDRAVAVRPREIRGRYRMGAGGLWGADV